MKISKRLMKKVDGVLCKGAKLVKAEFTDEMRPGETTRHKNIRVYFTYGGKEMTTLLSGSPGHEHTRK